MNAKRYSYVGSSEISERSLEQPEGAPIHKREDLLSWVAGMLPSKHRELTATFVICPVPAHNFLLRLADRHSEHVACAGGQDVLSAGEITFIINGDAIEVSEITNQSTGYCPEPESWDVVKCVLDALSIPHPDSFTDEITFRQCEACNTINIVKEDWFYCAVCDEELPLEYNFTPNDLKRQ